MKSRIEVDPNDPSGRSFVGRNDYGDDVVNLAAALHDLLCQVQDLPADTPAMFDRRLRFVDTVVYANAVRTHAHYLPRLLSMSDRSPNARLISAESS